MAKEGWGVASPNKFFQFFSEMGRAFFETKLFPVDSSLGHLPINRTYHLASKLDKGRVLFEQQLTYFFDHEDDTQSHFGMK